MSLIEWVATALGVACVALGALRSVWTFPTAFGSVLLIGWVVWAARLYSDALLQLFFVVVNGYGWVSWRRARAAQGDVVVEVMSARERWLWLAGWLVATLLWGGAMHSFTDASYPWADAGIAIASVAGQIQLAQRRLENWFTWIMVDVASIRRASRQYAQPLVLIVHRSDGVLDHVVAQRGRIRAATAIPA